MKLLVLTKSKIYTTPHSLTFDGIFAYSDDAYLGIKWHEMEKLIVAGFVSPEDFGGQKLSFRESLPVSAIGISAACEAREKSMAGRLKNAFAFFSAILAVRKQLADVDIAISTYFDYSAFQLLAVRLVNPRIKILNDVITDYPVWNFAKKHSQFERAYLLIHQRITYFLSDKVWLISQYLAKRYPTKKGSVVYNSSVSEDLIVSPKELSKDIIKLLFVGRFAGEKIPDTAIMVLDMLKKRGYRARLTFVGGGPLEDELKDFAHAYNLERDVIFFGKVFDRPKLFSIFRESDFFIFPSLMGEALGFVALEAMSQGTVVLGTASGGISEVIENGQSGVLVPARKANERAQVATELAARIIELIDHPERYAEMSRAAVARMGRFTIENCAKVQRKEVYSLLNSANHHI